MSANSPTTNPGTRAIDAERIRVPVSEWSTTVEAASFTDAIGTTLDPTRRSPLPLDLAFWQEHGPMTIVPTSVCAHIRRRRHQCESSSTLSDEFGIAQDNINYHARGDCAHASRVPTVDGKTSKWACASWRRRAELGDTTAEIRDAVDADIDHERVKVHVRGECRHDDDLVAPQPRETVSRSECWRWQRRARNESASTIAEETDWKYPTVLRHASGRCSHEVGSLE